MHVKFLVYIILWKKKTRQKYLKWLTRVLIIKSRLNFKKKYQHLINSGGERHHYFFTGTPVDREITSYGTLWYMWTCGSRSSFPTNINKWQIAIYTPPKYTKKKLLGKGGAYVKYQLLRYKYFKLFQIKAIASRYCNDFFIT